MGRTAEINPDSERLDAIVEPVAKLAQDVDDIRESLKPTLSRLEATGAKIEREDRAQRLKRHMPRTDNHETDNQMCPQHGVAFEPIVMPISLADAREWLAEKQGANATAIIFDPPYAVGTPVRGREDGAAGSVFAPFGFMHKTLSLCAGALKPGGVVFMFADWRRMPDLTYIGTTVGLRAATCIAWTRNRPGTGGLFRSAWDPIMVMSRGTPDAVDRSAVKNVIVADYQTKRTHPYQKPEAVFEALLPRICRRGDLVLDPFAGSGASRVVARRLGLAWDGCDIDPAFAA